MEGEKLIDLFKRVKIEVIDGDDRVNNSDINYRKKLKKLLDNGMELHGIQIFHYAAPHYATRYNSMSLRYLNALINGGSCIRSIKGSLGLNNNESNELQKGSSEIIAVGLANMMVCRWFNINANYIAAIEGTGKRCDFRFELAGKRYIYEVKGRKNRNKLTEALNDSLKKKLCHIADEKLAFICHLPRDLSPVSIRVFDPEVDDGESYDKIYNIVDHYSKMCRLSGLFILAEMLENRMQSYESSRIWTDEPMKYKENVSKMINEVTINNQKYLTSTYPHNLKQNNEDDTEMFLYFGISDKVVKMLEQWKIEEVSSYNQEMYVDEKNSISYLNDGTFMCIRKTRF